MTTEVTFLYDFLEEVETYLPDISNGDEEYIETRIDELHKTLHDKITQLVIKETNLFLKKHGSDHRLNQVSSDEFFQNPLFALGA